MAITWKPGEFSTTYAFLGRICVGEVTWVSRRRAGDPGYQFRSELFGSVPDVDESGAIFPTEGGAKKDGENKAVAYADYIGRKVHGEEAWARVTRGL